MEGGCNMPKLTMELYQDLSEYAKDKPDADFYHNINKEINDGRMSRDEYVNHLEATGQRIKLKRFIEDELQELNKYVKRNK